MRGDPTSQYWQYSSCEGRHYTCSSVAHSDESLSFELAMCASNRSRDPNWDDVISITCFLRTTIAPSPDGR